MHQDDRRGCTLYRAHRLEARPVSDQGWEVRIRTPGERAVAVLRNTVPGGLPILLDEARLRVDRRLDGAAWHREP